MTNTEGTPADWYADPAGRFEYRWWDGAAWSSSVSTSGNVQVDPVPISGGPAATASSMAPKSDPGYVPTTNKPAAKIQAQAAKATGQAAPGNTGSDLLSQPILVVNQKVKLIELNNEYAIYDGAGNQIGGIRQIGQNAFKKLVRFVGGIDQFFTHQLEIVDLAGSRIMHIKRPGKIFKSKFEITGPNGEAIGRIVQENLFGKIRFALESNGQKIGSINAENWRAWNFAIRDHSDNEVARISKTWEGLAKTMFTSADNYVVQVHSPLAEPLRSLVVASAVSVDTALKQDSRGFN